MFLEYRTNLDQFGVMDLCQLEYSFVASKISKGREYNRLANCQPRLKKIVEGRVTVSRANVLSRVDIRLTEVVLTFEQLVRRQRSDETTYIS